MRATDHDMKSPTTSFSNKNIISERLKWRVVSFLLLFSVFIVSCRKAPKVSYTQAQKDKIENELKSLEAISDREKRFQQYKLQDNKLGMMIGYRYLGLAYRNSTQFDEAIHAHREEYNLAVELKDTVELVIALNNIGTNFRRVGALDEASTYHYKALMLSDQYQGDSSFVARKNRVISLNGLGNVHLTLGNTEVADSAFRLALKGEEQLGSKLGQAINYANLGSLLEKENKIDSARLYFKKSLKLNREAGSELGEALCQLDLGELEEKDQAWDQAVRRYEKAYQILKNIDDSWHWLNAVFALIDFYISQDNYAKAGQYIAEAKPVVKQLGSFEYLTRLYHEEYMLSQKQGDSRRALESYVKSQMYKDSLMGETKTRRIQNLRLEYERKNKQREMMAVRQKMKQEKTFGTLVLISSICILLFCIAVIGFLWYVIRIRSKNHKMMVQIERIKDSFYTNLTHEFRTPLTIILGFSKQIADGSLVDRDELKKAGELMHRQGSGLLDLINQLLEIAKLKSGTVQLDYHHQDIIAYIRMITESHQALAKAKHVELMYMPDQTTLMMDFVPNYVIKVVRNLISNAIKFTPKNGRIKVITQVEYNFFQLQVVDNGKGIPAEDLPYIFDLFYQAGRSSAEVGNGVGLAMIKQLVDMMDGTLTVESEVGKGSTFTVRLPLKTEKQVSPTNALEEHNPALPCTEPVEENVDTEVNEERASVLIVEDNTDVAHYIGMQLNRDYNLFFAHDGAEGLDKAKDLMPDIILTDMMMPVKDGLALCRDIKSSDVLNHIPVIMITARCNDADKLSGLEAGADAYLEKPFSADELKVRIKNLIERNVNLSRKYALSSQTDINNMSDLSTVNQAFLHKFIDVVYAHMADRTTDAESIASDLCMTSKQLRTKIYAITGDNTSVYIQKIRMEKAKRLLKSEQSTSVGDIAMRCGFEDVSYFSRAFKKMYGITPSQYRRQPL